MLVGGTLLAEALRPEGAGATTVTAWDVDGNDDATGTYFLGTTNAQPLIVKTDRTERLRIAATGNVGIGTASPDVPLEVVAVGNAAGFFSTSSDGLKTLSANSATEVGGSAVVGSLTAGSPGANASAVAGEVTSTTDAAAKAVSGIHFGNGTGVSGIAKGSGTGVEGSTGAYDGLAGYFANQHSNSGDTVGGCAVRAIASKGTYDQLRGSVYTSGKFAAGEFAGQIGVIGASSGETLQGVGVIGQSAGQAGLGVAGVASGDGSCGVYARGEDANGYGLYVVATKGLAAAVQGSGGGEDALNVSGNTLIDGDLALTGTLSKGGGSFKIDHPLDPANKYLYHSFVESPDMMNVYNGTVLLNDSGEATVEMAAWFETLNRDFRYQLTAIGAPAPNLHVSSEVTDGRFGIAGGQAGQKVSWQLTGVRQDAWANANRIPVEEKKPDADRGRYLHPKLFEDGHSRPLVRVERHKLNR